MTVHQLLYLVPHWSESNRVNNVDLLTLAGWSSILGIIVAVLSVIVLSSIRKKKDFKGMSLFWPFAVVWLCGFVVYDVGMYTGEISSLLGNIPMAILHAFGIFVLDSDVSAIHEKFHNNVWFMFAFSLTHFAAAFISLWFVIKHFGFNIVATIKRFFEKSWFGPSKEISYIFWGMNDENVHLAKSINVHHKEKGGTYRIVIIRTNNDADKTNTQNGFERLFNFLSIEDCDIEKIKDIEHCITTNTFVSLSEIKTTSLENPPNILKELGLNSVVKLIEKKTSNEVHVFFLSEDEVANIKAVANLKKDKTINEFITMSDFDKRKAVIYCHTRSNSVHSVIEYDQPKNGIEVKVIDSSRLCVDLLKNNPRLHPANYVEIEDDATVSSPFNSLVVGFGQTGLDVVRFLYEFGAFVKTGSTSKNVSRSDFHCDVVDKNMADLAGLFTINAPSIKPAIPFKDKENRTALITLHQMDCQSVYFYEKMEEWVKNLNYAVIVTNDDELNISLGVRILRLAIRYRENLNHFRILVKVRQDEDGHFRKIANFYNRLWEAEMKKDVYDDFKRQRIVASNSKPEAPITLFGTIDEIFQYDYVVSEKFKKMAKMFKERYDESIREMQIQSGVATNNVVSWDEEYKLYMQLDDGFSDFSPTYSNLMKLRRMQSQNFENCFHVHTKQRLAMCALGADEYNALTSHHFFRKNNDIKYQWKSQAQYNEKITKVLDTLAQTEHLRWNASYEILGYRSMGGETFKDEAKLQHGCLKTWQELSTEVQSYDYNVVDVSLNIINLS